MPSAKDRVVVYLAVRKNVLPNGERCQKRRVVNCNCVIDAPSSQTNIDCWAKMPAIAPCHVDVVTEGIEGLARSPAA